MTDVQQNIGRDAEPAVATTRPDSTRPDSTRADSTRPDSTRPDSTRADSTREDSTRPDSTRPDSPGTAGPTATDERAAARKAERRDPRYLALRNFALSISAFNVLGYTVLGFEQPWSWPILAVLVGYAVEIVVEYLSAWAGRRPRVWAGRGPRGMYVFLLPSHITSLAVSMLLYSNSRFGPVAFGVAVAVGAKAILRAPVNGRMRHFMNPSNFGITVTLLVFPLLSISPPYHFTENVPDVFRMMIPMIILVAGTILNAQLTRKVPLIVGWVGAFVIQAVVRALIWDVALYSALAVMTGVAFVLFTNYMITDPGTTPTSGRAQFLFGAGVGVVYGVLMLANVVYTLFFAVTIVCAGRGLYWWARTLLERRRRARIAPSSPAAEGAAP